MAFHLHIVAANEAEDTVHEDVEGELALWRVRAGDFAKVGRSRKCFPTRLLVKNLFRLQLCELRAV